MKRKIAVLACLLAAWCALCGSPSPAAAQVPRTWVSGTGDDVNPCSRLAPCRTFRGALRQSAVGGEIDCLDPGSFGTVVITKSITIECPAAYALILHPGGVGITVDFNAFANADSQKTVRLRHLNLNGLNTGTVGIQIIGGTGATGSNVYIENCVLDGGNPNGGRGIYDTRSGASNLFVAHTTVRNMPGGAGIGVAPASGTPNIQVAVNDVRLLNSYFGLAIGAGVTARVNHSVFSGNANGGVEADIGSFMTVDNSLISFNGTGVWAGGTINVSNSDVAYNGSTSTATLSSFSNNRFFGNSNAGTIAPIGSATSPTGQQ